MSYRFATASRRPSHTRSQGVLTTIQYVRGNAKSLNLAPDRIGVFGHSAGGIWCAATLGAGARSSHGDPQDQFAKESTEVKMFAGIYGVYDVAGIWQKYDAQSPLQNDIGWS